MRHYAMCNNYPPARVGVPQECTMKVQEGKFKLQDLLVVPMQRVLKYHLLLKVGGISQLQKPTVQSFLLSLILHREDKEN